ncbi:kinesin light chain 1 [Xylogone sp. PMI_703]|nr:kinesin light chain 1 [Xylogone sp. PMI_703]
MMRLLERLENGDLKLISFNDDNLPPYAILSHTWTEGQEVTYGELVSGIGKDKTGYAKIRFCVDKAAEDGLQYSWVDTCCIDKSTSDEVSTAINSMFRWYQRAIKCYVYLSDVLVPAEVADAQAFQITWAEAFRRSRWFTRGWTLQELLAPPTVEFFSKDYKWLGNRISLEQEIHQITKIPIGILRGQTELSELTVEERMNWAAHRTTTLKEDKVYCLLGIFGVFLPLIYGEGEEYATERLRDEIQKRQEGRGTARLQNLTGCGKSALALELGYRALTQNVKRLVFWVSAINQESFELAYREIGNRLCIRGISDDNANIKRIVKDALNSDNMGRWLMIVDNADDSGVLMRERSTGSNLEPVQLRDYLPYNPQGKILFTTRSRKVAEDLTPSSVLKLSEMGEAEAQQLLKRRISNSTLLHDKKALNQLLEIVAYLPLAIVQAAAFMNNNDISVSGYISLFRKAGTAAELFGEHFEDPSRYPEMDSTIAKTWHISFDQIRKQDSLAAEYLSFMACIDRINIPQSLLPPGGSPVQQAKAVGTLKAYAFITERQQGVQELESEKFFDMHRLVHMASEWWLDRHGEQMDWTAKTVMRLEKLIPYGGHERKEEWMMYLPHAIHMARLDYKLDKIARASLLDRIGRCQASLGQYSAAEKTHQQALLLRKRRLGKDHEQTLTSMNEVGVAFDNQGKYQTAETMHRQTLGQREKVLGPEHPSTLTSMYNLAHLLTTRQHYDDAAALYKRAYAGYSTVLGNDHPTTRACHKHYSDMLAS